MERIEIQLRALGILVAPASGTLSPRISRADGLVRNGRFGPAAPPRRRREPRARDAEATHRLRRGPIRLAALLSAQRFSTTGGI